MQSRHLQIPRRTRVVGKPEHRCMVPRSIGGSLQMQPLVCPQDTSILNIRFGRALPQHCQVPFLSTKDPLHELTSKVVSTLKNMTAEKQRRVIMLFRSKFLDETICPGGPASLTSPCHAWILPDNDFQRVPQPRTLTQDQQRVAQSDEQRVGRQPRHDGDMANRLWERLWRHGTRQQ